MQQKATNIWTCESGLKSHYSLLLTLPHLSLFCLVKGLLLFPALLNAGSAEETPSPPCNGARTGDNKYEAPLGIVTLALISQNMHFALVTAQQPP